MTVKNIFNMYIEPHDVLAIIFNDDIKIMVLTANACVYENKSMSLSFLLQDYL